jgi:putative copper resistance protein D
MAHEHAGTASGGWEGPAEGKAYSEFNHHLAGVFVLLIGLSELRTGLALATLAWTRFLLPVSMLLAGAFLMIWSDHEAWPVGSLSFTQTFFGGDQEILQHKVYGIMLLGVGSIELLRRTGRVRQVLWMIPLPAFAIIGGLMLFLHSHGVHPAAHKIALNHAIMGIMAVSAGSSKLMSGWTGPYAAAAGASGRSRWEIVWACFILLIGAQLLIYTE